ncbi:hypothetical protein NE237_008954 [Protea cynaroides]|uniref:Uncharacterized protein n=1 Tax=Protea cynaroides TaxID=273540 RepID=A0A9Q0KXN6_9MAGN|nr:hypothetical protein NE237_008954 [Protea cynaroides]
MREDEVPLLEEGSEGSVIQRIWGESKKIWQIAGPAIFSRVALYAMTLIIQAFAGHLGNLDLAPISIASTVIISISFGFLRVGEEFLFIMSRILAGFDIDTVMGSAVVDAVLWKRWSASISRFCLKLTLSEKSSRRRRRRLFGINLLSFLKLKRKNIKMKGKTVF